MKWLVDIIYFDDSKVRLDKLWIAASFTYFVSFEFNYQVSIREGQKEESLPGCLIISFIGRTILNFSPVEDGEKLPVSHSPHTTSALNPKHTNHNHWLVIHMFCNPSMIDLPVISTTLGWFPHRDCFSLEHWISPTFSQQQLSTIVESFLQRYVQCAVVTRTVGPGGFLKIVKINNS